MEVQDSLEDRIAAAGKHDEFSAAVEKFRKKKKKTRAAQHELYEVITNLGGSPEEADEFINLEMSDGESVSSW